MDKTNTNDMAQAQIQAQTNSVKSEKLDIHKQTADASGFAGILELFIRKFKNLAFAVLLTPVTLMCTVLMGVAAGPAFYVYRLITNPFLESSLFAQCLSQGIGLSIGYLVYGVSIIFIVPIVNLFFCSHLKAWRGIWHSVQAIPWFIHNALTYLVRYTFLEFVTPSPLNILFYKMMGMKIGKGVVINSTNISDPCLIELDDYVTIGGSAHIMAHYGQKGFLVLAPVKIGAGSTIGLKASVMGGAQIGANCTVKPHAAVLPKTVLDDNTVV
jgi:hypothetical protein